MTIGHSSKISPSFGRYLFSNSKHRISICGRAVLICGRAVSICGRAVSICGKVVSICGRSVSICAGRSRFVAGKSRFAAGQSRFVEELGKNKSGAKRTSKANSHPGPPNKVIGRS